MPDKRSTRARLVAPIQTSDMVATNAKNEPTSAASITRYLSGAGIALWALVMALEPDVGLSAPWPYMALFWALQIGIGLTVLQVTLYLLSQADKTAHWPLWILILGSGVLGSGLLAPLYWLIGEGLMVQTLGFDATDIDDLDAQMTFGLSAVIHEFGDIVGPVTAAWILVSWPRLQGLLPPLVKRHVLVDGESINNTSVEGDPIHLPAWRDAIPYELGNDLIAVKSELQYLRVFTTQGSALVLGALREVEDGEGAAGMRVHRSWWVHINHVRRIREHDGYVICELSDGRQVPVSRRRKSDVISYFDNSPRTDKGVGEQTTPPNGDDQNIRLRPKRTDKGL